VATTSEGDPETTLTFTLIYTKASEVKRTTVADGKEIQ
jgi:hypothetical protein